MTEFREGAERAFARAVDRVKADLDPSAVEDLKKAIADMKAGLTLPVVKTGLSGTSGTLTLPLKDWDLRVDIALHDNPKLANVSAAVDIEAKTDTVHKDTFVSKTGHTAAANGLPIVGGGGAGHPAGASKLGERNNFGSLTGNSQANNVSLGGHQSVLQSEPHRSRPKDKVTTQPTPDDGKITQVDVHDATFRFTVTPKPGKWFGTDTGIAELPVREAYGIRHRPDPTRPLPESLTDAATKLADAREKWTAAEKAADGQRLRQGEEPDNGTLKAAEDKSAKAATDYWAAKQNYDTHLVAARATQPVRAAAEAAEAAAAKAVRETENATNAAAAARRAEEFAKQAEQRGQRSVAENARKEWQTQQDAHRSAVEAAREAARTARESARRVTTDAPTSQDIHVAATRHARTTILDARQGAQRHEAGHPSAPGSRFVLDTMRQASRDVSDAAARATEAANQATRATQPFTRQESTTSRPASTTPQPVSHLPSPGTQSAPHRSSATSQPTPRPANTTTPPASHLPSTGTQSGPRSSSAPTQPAPHRSSATSQPAPHPSNPTTQPTPRPSITTSRPGRVAPDSAGGFWGEHDNSAPPSPVTDHVTPRPFAPRSQGGFEPMMSGALPVESAPASPVSEPSTPRSRNTDSFFVAPNNGRVRGEGGMRSEDTGHQQVTGPSNRVTMDSFKSPEEAAAFVRDNRPLVPTVNKPRFDNHTPGYRTNCAPATIQLYNTLEHGEVHEAGPSAPVRTEDFERATGLTFRTVPDFDAVDRAMLRQEVPLGAKAFLFVDRADKKGHYLLVEKQLVDDGKGGKEVKPVYLDGQDGLPAKLENQPTDIGFMPVPKGARLNPVYAPLSKPEAGKRAAAGPGPSKEQQSLPLPAGGVLAASVLSKDQRAQLDRHGAHAVLAGGGQNPVTNFLDAVKRGLDPHAPSEYKRLTDALDAAAKRPRTKFDLNALAGEVGVRAHVLGNDGRWQSYGPVSGRPVHVVDADVRGVPRFLGTKQVVELGRTGVVYPGPTKSTKDNADHVEHRGEFEVETIAGKHYVRVYTAVYDTALPGSDRKDVYQDASGKVTPSTGKANVAWVSGGRPLRAVQWVTKYHNDQVQKGETGMTPLLRSYLVPLDKYVLASENARPEAVSGKDGTLNVDQSGDVNQFGMRGPDLDTLRQHALEGSLVTYMPPESTGHARQDLSGRLEPISDLYERLASGPTSRPPRSGTTTTPGSTGCGTRTGTCGSTASATTPSSCAAWPSGCGRRMSCGPSRRSRPGSARRRSSVRTRRSRVRSRARRARRPCRRQRRHRRASTPSSTPTVRPPPTSTRSPTRSARRSVTPRRTRWRTCRRRSTGAGCSVSWASRSRSSPRPRPSPGRPR